MPRYADVELYEDCRIVANKEDDGFLVSELPTEDVVPVVHSFWKDDRETGCLMCGECGHLTDEMLGDFKELNEEESNAIGVPFGTVAHVSLRPKFCSRCGARMDGYEK